MDPLFPVAPENLADASDEQLASFIEDCESKFEEIRANPADYSGQVAEMQAAAETLKAVRAELSSRPDADDDTEPVETDTAAAATVEALALEALSSTEDETTGDGEDDDESAPAADDEESDDDDEEEAVTASVEESKAPTKTTTVVAVRSPSLPRPARARKAAPVQERQRVALTASAPNLGPEMGEEIDRIGLAEMMIKRRRDFGNIGKDTKGEKIPLAQMDWRDEYGEGRTLGSDEIVNQAKIAAVLDEDVIRAELERRKANALVAAGGLCAPVTPYYDLQMISTADRPVRAALPSFNAVRGGIRYARPAALTAITTAVDIVTASDDALGGTYATKSCQVIACPTFSETDVRAIYHCLQFGNLPARTFPELLAQYTDLVLAAHARVAESALLTDINTGSTKVTQANAQGLGATATLPSQVLAAAAGMRSRHRMAQGAVLRALFPSWVLELLVSDMYRTQFDRFDMTPDDFVRILRAANVEPSFYYDGPAGQGQVFGAQGDTTLVPFPTVVSWFLFPEGSWIYLDGGTLELGLVRDSVLNETNDFQIFGETFEAVAFVGVESLRIQSTVCDSGTVSLPNDVNCPIN